MSNAIRTLKVAEQTLKLTQYDPEQRTHVEVFPDTLDIDRTAVMFYKSEEGKFYTVPDANWLDDVEQWMEQWEVK